LRLTEETMVLESGKLVYRAPTPQAVDYYMASGFTGAGERLWTSAEIPPDAAPFSPLAIRLRDKNGRVVDTVRSTEHFTVEIEYQLDQSITGLRVGIYLLTMRGEYVFTSFDLDDPQRFEQLGLRQAGKYISRCTIPANTLNEGRYFLSVNASSFRIKRYFWDDRALAFSVDATGAPGKHWPEPRMGTVRPALDWVIERL
jgi:lipopolysaccharide transport system ATP-binding protein